jgi:hypothetical protein
MYGLQKKAHLISSPVMNSNRHFGVGQCHPDAAQEIGPSSESDSDADLRRLIHTIVRDFKGDTSAYFESLKPNSSGRLPSPSEEEESRVARRFVKSI